VLGHSHIVWAGAATLAAAGPLSSVAGHPLAPAQVAVAAGLAAGGALLPDLDQPGSTISRSLGPVTEALAHVVHRLSGGHRRGTHALVFPPLVFALATILLGIHPAALAPLLLVAFALVLRHGFPRGMARHGALVVAGGALAATVATIAWVPLGCFVPAALAAGCLEHSLADALTSGGVPFLLPLSARQLSLPLIRRTGSGVELALTGIVSIAAVLLALHDFDPAAFHSLATAF
jgi:membrane-bound metal-dependent hydrolase YbcI (DUF457 family)